MNNEFGNDFISITDDEGNEYELELLDTLEYEGQTYMALISADQDENSDELIILKTVEENGEELLSTPDDDEELDRIYEMFMDRMLEDDEKSQ